jgi:tRNA-dihydrouridine synthase
MIMYGFWEQLDKGFWSLAPMEDVTDTAFREVVITQSDPSVLRVLFTEFTSTDGICDERGRAKVSQRLVVNESEKNYLRKHNIALVAQIWGNNPEKFHQTSRYINDLKLFDGIDINMGCPVKKVVKKDTCSALIKNPSLAQEIIQATKDGTSLPVSVKTRIGFNTVDTINWTTRLLEVKPAAITLHGRTQKQMSEGEADWNEIKKAVELKNTLLPACLVIGNGDINTFTEGQKRIHETGVDGVMIGRGIFKNMGIFNKRNRQYEVHDRLQMLQQHIHLFRNTWGDSRNYHVLKRFYKVYVTGFKGASNLRHTLMESNHYDQALETIHSAMLTA